MMHARTAAGLHRATTAALVRHGRISPTAPTALTAPAEFAIAAILAVGLLSFAAGAAGGALPDKNQTPGLTLTGTTVTADGRTPVPRTRITVMPESTVTFTDIDGDFLVSWNGRDGWITLIPEERTRDGGEWCKRVVLRERPEAAPGSLVDLGLITVMPRAQVGYQLLPIAPAGHPRPARLNVAGPKPGEPDTCRVQLSYTVDIWGRVVQVDVSGGDEPPSGVRDALFSWVRGVPWTVGAETPCAPPDPFKGREWMDYAWADGAWVQVPGLKPQARQKAAGGVPPGR